jgi:hypothetical protein
MSGDANFTAKIELVAEACESLAHSVIDLRLAPDSEAHVHRNAVEAATDSLKEALRSILQPRLRLIKGGLQPYAFGVHEDDMPLCLKCQRHFRCADLACPDWHAAIREQHRKAHEQFERDNAEDEEDDDRA